MDRSNESRVTMWFLLPYKQCTERTYRVLPAVPVARNRGGARPFSIQSDSSASKGITKCSASISLRTRSMSSSFCLRTWNMSFMSDPAAASVRQISGPRREG